MNPFVICYLPGDVGEDVLILGSYPTIDAAWAAIVQTGVPFNYQVCEVWGQAVTPPMGTLTPGYAVDGGWLAVTVAVSVNGGQRLVGYGNFGSKADAVAWAKKQGSPAAFSFGQVQLTA